MKTPSADQLHHQIDDWLALAEADALAPTEHEALDLHLAACPVCRRIAAEHHAMSTLLKTTLEAHRPDAALEDRLLSRFREGAAELEEAAPSPENRWTLSMVAAGIARAFTLPAFRYGGALAGVAALVVTGAMLTHEPFPGSVRDLKRRIEEQAIYVETAKPGIVLSGSVDAAYQYSLTGNGDANRAKDQRGLILYPSNSPVNKAAPPSDMFATTAPVARTASGGQLTVAANKVAIEHPSAAPAPTPAPAGTLRFDYGTPIPKDSKSAGQAFGDTALAQKQTSAVDAEAKRAADTDKKIIRRGFVEMVVPGFDKAVAGIAAAAQEAGGFVDTQNQGRGPNGKVSGVVVVKVLPKNLDLFLEKTALLGEVKNRNTGAEDISKAYADTTARLANAKVMEGRLVKMLAEKDGKVSDLLQVERELGRVRAEIETMEAEIRLDDSQVRYATVTFQLRERDLSQGQADRATLLLSLLAPDGDVPDAVEKAKAALAAAAPDAEILSSRLEQEGDGATRTNAAATLSLRAPSSEADAAERVLRALGPVTAFTRTEEGTDANAPVRFEVRLLAEVDPIERTDLAVEVPAETVEAKAAALRAHAADFGATVRDSGFNRGDDGGTVATLRLRLPLERYPDLLARLKGEGKVLRFTEERHDVPPPAPTAGESRPTAATPLPSATAEIALTLQSAPALVPDANGPWAILRQTLAQGAAAFGWSLRMIGVALAFLAPWIGAAAVAGGVAWMVRWGRK